MEVESCIRRRPADLFEDTSPLESGHDYFLVVLNQPIHCKQAFKRCYEKARWRLYADGGANGVRDIEPADNPRSFPPHIILGDLDSLTTETQKYYSHDSCATTLISHDPDQYSTDFGKAVKWVRLLRDLIEQPHELAELIKPGTVQDFSDTIHALHHRKSIVKPRDGISNVIVFGGLGGRVDQGIGLLSEFAREDEKNGGQLRFWLVSERSVSWILNSKPDAAENQRSRHVIKLSPPRPKGVSEADGQQPLFSPNVGILPIFGRSCIGTRGLEWDVEDWETEMGGQVSTSNHVVSNDGVIEVSTTRPVLFTVEMADRLLDQEMN